MEQGEKLCNVGKSHLASINARKRLAALALPWTPLESLQRSPRSLAGGEGTGCPALGLLGLGLRPFGLQLSP